MMTAIQTRVSIELKIKAKHLAAEARIIRAEANKLKARAKKARDKQRSDVADSLSRQVWNINYHNKTVVSREARATHLARAFIKGTPYKTVENKTVERLEDYIVHRIVKMANKYHYPSVDFETVMKWIEA